MIISEEDVDTVLEMVRQLVRDTKVRKLVLEHQDQVLKVVRCHYIEEYLREDLQTEILKTIVGINVSALEVFDNDAVVSVETLIEQGIVKNPRDGVKILGNGELTKKLTVQANAFSAGAVAKIEASRWKSRGDLMLETFRRAFQIKDIRRKAWYILF